MRNPPPSNLHDLINMDMDDPNHIWLTKQESLRKLIGVLGMSLPLLLYGSVYLSTCHGKVLESISHYYYTRYGSILVIVVSLLGIFLLIYKGYEVKDSILSSLAGLCAIILLLLPTANISGTDASLSVTKLVDNSARITLHYIAAAIFLISLAVMSIFVFTLSREGEAPNPKKTWRNRCYIGLGIGMLLAVGIIPLGTFTDLIPNYDDLHLTFWMETIAIELFGLSWLIKGGMILKD